MKKLFTIFLVAGVLFSLSAGVSWFLHSNQQKPPEGDESTDLGALKAGKGIKSFPPGNESQPSHALMLPALRTPKNPEAESVVQMANSLRNQMDALRAREKELTSRQKHLEMIFLDIRKEREALNDLQKQINEEMKALMERMSSLEQKNTEVTQQRDKVVNQVKEIKKNITEFEGVEQNRIKQMAAIYDTMEPESAGQILMQMVDTGKLDTAVKILSTMRERQAARILSQIEDRAVTVQIMEKLKDLKRPPQIEQK